MIEVVDGYGTAGPGGAGQEDEIRFGSLRPRRFRPPRWLVVLAVGACLAAIAGVAISRHDQARARGPVVVSFVGHRLLGVTAAWELDGYGPAGLIRVQFAQGRVTRTTVPALDSSGPVSFVAGNGQAIIRPLDRVPGYLVSDGDPARRLPGALGASGAAIEGPAPGTAWLQPDYSARRLSLFRLNGTSTGVSLRLPAGGPWQISPDGRGYVLLAGSNKYYDALPEGFRRLPGTPVAVGMTHLLTVECNGPYHCANLIVDPISGIQRRLPGPLFQSAGPPGLISPDDSLAAIFGSGHDSKISLMLISLTTGAYHLVSVSLDDSSPLEQSLAWSPDSKWLFVVTAQGRVAAISAATGRVERLGVTLPPVSQIAVWTPGTPG